ncbi:hypothetical protein KUTeg_017171 [Tegillarca granosa]|uniref:Apple domain-containing protein n=1 Tax=Tegillarca granosa TaxID=220873 RepID=A0ABQ9ERS0_TEGGR|nr:hypothetical protein KUTeg_017171 [Tegillarca granosa]
MKLYIPLLQIITVILVLLIVKTQSQTTSPPHCTPKLGAIQPGPNDPPIPTLPNTFQTRIEGNIHDKRYTMTAEEYFSDDLNKATLKLTSAGMTTTLIFDYPNDQLFYVEGLNCQISNLTTDDNNLLFGTQSIAGIPHVYSTNGVLHFAAKFGESYKGTTFVRGILVDHWQTCLNWTQLNSVFTLDYYFTVRNWTDAIQTPQIPTPPGVICPGRVQTRKLPRIPSKYHYRQEIITAAFDEIQMADVIRFDYKNRDSIGPTYSTNPLSEVHDYNTGIRYIRDQITGNCSAYPISNSSFDVVAGSGSFSANGTNVLHLKNPLQFFYLDNTYAYVGKLNSLYYPEKLPLERMIYSMTTLPHHKSVHNDVLIIQILYAIVSLSVRTRQTVEIVDLVNIIKGMDQLYQIAPHVISSQIWYDQDYKLVRYDMAMPSAPFYSQDPFTIVHDFNTGLAYNIDNTLGNCTINTINANSFDAELDKNAALKNGAYVIKMKNPLELFNLNSTYRYAGQRTIRGMLCDVYETTTTSFHVNGVAKPFTSILQFFFLSVGLYFTYNFFDFSEIHPDLSNFDVTQCFTDDQKQHLAIWFSDDFTLIPGKQSPHKSTATFQNINSPNACALLCRAETNFHCEGFDYCPGQTSCQLSSEHIEDGTKLSDSKTCSHYSSILLSHFKKTENNVAYQRGDAAIPGISIDDCARTCMRETTFDCKSFDYCYRSGFCLMSGLHPDEQPKLIKPSTSCDMYSRNYLDSYSQSPGKTLLLQADQTIPNINTANLCAKACNSANSTCKSFEYCSNTKSCRLLKKHQLDIPTTAISTSPVCSFYSRNYIDDFQELRGMTSSSGRTLNFVNVSRDACAKLCVENEEFLCQNFAYCGSTGTCLIMADVAVKGKNIAASQSCSVFLTPALPTLPQQFQARVEAAIIDKNLSVSAEEYFDANNECSTSNLTTDDNNMLFGNKMGPSGSPHTYTTNGVLHFAKKFGEVFFLIPLNKRKRRSYNNYLGQTTVRGIKVNHWQSCMYWPELFANFTLDYYFSGKVWYDKTFYNMVRYDFRPQPNTAPYYNTDAATEIHDYNTESLSLFLGVAYAIDRTMANCSIIPIQNASFDASVNISSSSQFTLTMRSPAQLFYLDNTYSFEGQRTSARGLKCDVFISKRTDFMIQGQKTNATLEFYFLAQDWSEFNNIGNINQKALDVPVRLDIFLSNNVKFASYDFYNFAQENPEITVFDITPCFGDLDRISFKLVFYGNFDSPVKMYKRIFLLQMISVISKVSGASPIRITNPIVQMQNDQAFFVANLVEKSPSLDKFRKIPDRVLQYRNDATYTYVSDPSDCADYCVSNTNFTCNSFDYCAQQQTCSLSKSHTEDGTLVSTPGQCDHYSRTLGGAYQAEVSLQTAWQNLRNAVVKQLVTVTLKFDSGNVTNTLNQFRDMQNRYVQNFDDLILTGMSVDDCAQSCIGQETFVCQSFEYEYLTGTCYLSHLHPDEHPKLIKTLQGVDLYIQNVILREYTTSPIKPKMYVKNDVIKTISFMKENVYVPFFSILCKCKIIFYLGDYTTKFTEVPGTTLLSSSNVIYQNIFSANQCAKLCVDLNEFNCKSFDYCDDIGSCFLGKTHYFDAPKSNIKADPMCNHWSRNYLGDFKYTKRKIIPMRDDRVIDGVSVAQCAKLCVQEESFSCASFDYCGNYTECRLSSATTKGVGQVTLEASAYCDVYSRQSFPDGTAYVANYQMYYGPPKKSSGYGTASHKISGAVAGIAVAMVVIGLLLAFGVIFAYMKFSNRTADDMKIQFSKHMDSAESS